jgi:hypothetical protein
MIKKDYIMRMVQQFTIAIAQILKLKGASQHSEALNVIDQTFHKLFGLSSTLIDSLSAESVVELLKSNDSGDAQKYLLIAKLLKEKAEIHDSQETDCSSKTRYLKCLDLYLRGVTCGESVVVSDCFSSIDRIIGNFEQHELPNSTKYKLMDYYEKTGRYSEVENLLFDLVELEGYRDIVIEEGIFFYARLMAKTDQELAAGNLPKDEVMSGKASLERMRG